MPRRRMELSIGRTSTCYAATRTIYASRFYPAAVRITRYLQQDGIVAEGVDPVLITVYRSGLKAVVFRIHPEKAAILVEDQIAEDAE